LPVPSYAPIAARLRRCRFGALWTEALLGPNFASLVDEIRRLRVAGAGAESGRATMDTLDPTNSTPATVFSHNREGDTEFVSGGLRDFFRYRDLGIAAATNGQVIAQLVKAERPPEEGTGWHRHEANFHIVLMLQGWARFMYEDKVTLVKAGDCVHQRPGIVHFLFDYSPDMDYLEIASPVPPPTPWS
jgi:quercetin dioxygenase-like cupin family protein